MIHGRYRGRSEDDLWRRSASQAGKSQAIKTPEKNQTASRDLLISAGKSESGDVLVAVRDSGPGLAPADIDPLFRGFYTTKPNGLGLGLSICSSIIEAHGGRLRASANAPRGAVFQFTLPAQPDVAPHS